MGGCWFTGFWFRDLRVLLIAALGGEVRPRVVGFWGQPGRMPYRGVKLCVWVRICGWLTFQW